MTIDVQDASNLYGSFEKIWKLSHKPGERCTTNDRLLHLATQFLINLSEGLSGQCPNHQSLRVGIDLAVTRHPTE